MSFGTFDNKLIICHLVSLMISDNGRFRCRLPTARTGSWKLSFSPVESDDRPAVSSYLFCLSPALVPAVVRVAALASIPLLELSASVAAAGLPAPVSAAFPLLLFVQLQS